MIHVCYIGHVVMLRMPQGERELLAILLHLTSPAVVIEFVLSNLQLSVLYFIDSCLSFFIWSLDSRLLLIFQFIYRFYQFYWQAKQMNQWKTTDLPQVMGKFYHKSLVSTSANRTRELSPFLYDLTILTKFNFL